MARTSKARRQARPTVVGSRANRISTATTLKVNNAVNTLAGASGHVGKAAEIIAEGIKARAAEIPSTKIPPTVHVGSFSAETATIYASGQPAVIIETGGRHPLFGDREHWYTQNKVLFMEEGAGRALDKAAAEYGKTVDDWLTGYE